MAEIVLRVRLTSGDHIDVSYADPHLRDDEDLVRQAVATLADDSGALRTRHGDRLLVLFSRGVAAVEVAPLGAIL